MSPFRVVTLGCGVVAIGLALRASPMPSPPAADPAVLTRLASELLAQEPTWRRAARQQFPGDQWSQDDAFHNVEQITVRVRAARAGVSVGELFDALDRDLRVHPGTRLVHAVPCKPRPFYD